VGTASYYGLNGLKKYVADRGDLEDAFVIDIWRLRR